MARALLKGSGRDEWPATAGAERLRDGPNLTPAAAANEGAAGGVQRLVTDSAGGGKNKMKERGEEFFHDEVQNRGPPRLTANKNGWSYLSREVSVLGWSPDMPNHAIRNAAILPRSDAASAKGNA